MLVFGWGWILVGAGFGWFAGFARSLGLWVSGFSFRVLFWLLRIIAVWLVAVGLLV